MPGAIGHRDAGFPLGVLSRLPGVDPDAEIGPSCRRRPARLKAVHDLGTLFRLNANIAPVTI